MSLVPTYVYASDGKYYKDPVIEGNDFFLCFDDDDPPELVVQVPRKCHWKTLRKRAEAILKEIGVTAKFQSEKPRDVSQRIFGKKEEFKLAVSWFLNISSVILANKITKHEGKCEVPRGDCVVYDARSMS